jgi:inhibitor of KinA sporulation pathway (predicted exonuclease)
MSRNQLADKLIILDIEATCDEPRPTWRSEVIEIGVCLLDRKTLVISDKRSLLIKPETSPVTEFCTSLTTITKEMLDREGTTLAKAIEVLETEYLMKRRSWGSWGFYDNMTLNLECAAKHITFPGADKFYLNLKNILSVERGWSSDKGVGEALKAFNLEFEGTQHRGHDDAENIARIYREHLRVIRSK